MDAHPFPWYFPDPILIWNAPVWFLLGWISWTDIPLHDSFHGATLWCFKGSDEGRKTSWRHIPVHDMFVVLDWVGMSGSNVFKSQMKEWQYHWYRSLSIEPYFVLFQCWMKEGKYHGRTSLSMIFPDPTLIWNAPFWYLLVSEDRHPAPWCFPGPILSPNVWLRYLFVSDEAKKYFGQPSPSRCHTRDRGQMTWVEANV